MSALLESLLTREQREQCERADLRERYLDAIGFDALNLDGTESEEIGLDDLRALVNELEAPCKL